MEAVWTGRKPNSVGIGLGGLGIDDGSFLKVDEQMRLPAPGLYAVGDVNGISLLDGTAFFQVIVAIDCVLGGKKPIRSTVDPSLRPHRAGGG